MKRIVNVFVVLFLMAVSVNQVSAQEAQKGKEAGKPIPSEVKIFNHFRRLLNKNRNLFPLVKI